MTRSETSSGQGQRLRNVTIVVGLAVGLLLRLWFVAHAARVAGDTLVYGDIAKNWLEHGIYGFTEATAATPDALPIPTLIRLPGYPAFLALCFSLLGKEHYTAVMLVQIVVDLLTCALVASLAGRLFGPRAFRVALWLSATCPFTASYVAAPLAETLTLFCVALAFYSLLRWQQLMQESQETASPYNRWLFILSATLAYAILLRPEQGLLAAAILPAVLWCLLTSQPVTPADLFRKASPALLAALLVILPLAPWTARNWRTFHVFQPLAPRYATDPGESIPFGFQRWYRTWAIDFTSTEDVYWNYEGERIDVADLPTRAFDNNAQYAATADLFSEYNETAHPTPEMDARFNALAEQRIQNNPVRYYLALPVARLLNMALRPRTEMLPTPLEWWKFTDHPGQTIFASAYAALNLAYLIFAGIGLHRWHCVIRDDKTWGGYAPLAWAMIASIALRSALLLTLDNSEPRYTLELFPILIVAIAALFRIDRHPDSNRHAFV